MKKASMKLFDLVYGELIPVESKFFGKMVFIFYTVDDQLKPQIVYYPSTKEVKTLREMEVEFSSFIPLHRDEFIKQFSNCDKKDKKILQYFGNFEPWVLLTNQGRLLKKRTLHNDL